MVQGQLAVERVGRIGADPFDPRVRTLDRRHFDLHEQLGARQAGDATAERRGTALREPRRALTVASIGRGTLDRERATADDVVQ